MKNALLKMVIFSICLSTFYNQCQDNNKKKFILITMLYNEKREERIQEYLTCLHQNLAHNSIAKIHILYDISADDDENRLLNHLLQYPQINISYIKGRATYQNCFALANSLYKQHAIIISNADIFFNETLALLDTYDLSNNFLAITRWTVNKDATLNLYYGNNPISTSQDSWIFQAPIREFANSNIPLGILGCDNAIAYQAQKAELIVINPCLSIQCCHLHQSNIRNDSLNQVVPPPYFALPITTLPNSGMH